MELRGRLSNPTIVGKVREASAAIAAKQTSGSEAADAMRRQRRWRIADRLGKHIVDELLADRCRGLTLKDSAERYGISMSSVKRILRNGG